MSEASKDIHRKKIGKWGEAEAESYFLRLGLPIVDRNFRTREGEVDLIIQEDGETVFVEVKTRTNLDFGYPEEAVSEEKMDHLLSAAEKYLELHPEIALWRMDVLSIIGKPKSSTILFEWFKNVE
jgi:putative endonuclease